MKCPTCPNSTLVMADRSGIEIDYCPDCRGVWLDRGELDKIIERNASATAAAQPAPAPAPAPAPVAQPQQQQPQQQFQPQPQWQGQGQGQGQGQPMQSNSKYHGKYHSKYHDPRGGSYPRKKKSFLGEMFDF